MAYFRDFDYLNYCYWWNAPSGVNDYDFYDYNNNWILEDNEIQDIVADNIYEDPGIPLSDFNNIKIEVKDGVANLSGEVWNPRTKPLAYADAFWSPGIIDVNSTIKVKQRKGKTKNK